MTKKLPFKVQPQTRKKQIGSEKAGIFELPSIGGLSVGEQIFIDETVRALPDAYATASQIAVQIDSEEKLNDLIFAFNIVTNPFWVDDKKKEFESQEEEGKLSAKELQQKLNELDSKSKTFEKCRIKYAPQIIDLNNQTNLVAREKQIISVTAVLQNRLLDEDKAIHAEKKKEVIKIVSQMTQEVLSNYLIKYEIITQVTNQLSDQLAEKLNLWTQADTKALNNPLFQAIWDFVQTETKGDTEEESTEITAEDVGKPPEGNSKPLPLTGQNSTGEFKDTAGKTPVSVAKTSPSNPSG